jgi:hypothetical protein
MPLATFSTFPESTIFPIQGQRIWLLIRGISPVFADIYCAKMLPLFLSEKNLRTAARNLFNICHGINYIPHSETKIWLLIHGITPVFADIYFAKILHSFYRKIIFALPLATFLPFAGVNYIPHSGIKNLAAD